jgi:hypothetical protein
MLGEHPIHPVLLALLGVLSFIVGVPALLLILRKRA